MPKNIELEFRAEIPRSNFKRVLGRLRARGKLISKTKRLSVMYFGKIGRSNIDIRVRITNGKSEVVVKKGDFHAHNRTEVAQAINKNQFIGAVKLMAQLGFTDVKVGERETHNFNFGNGVIASLGRGGDISYLEIEKMTDNGNQEKDKEELIKIIKGLKINLIKDKKEFLDLCRRLNETCDWKFNQSKKDYEKLEGLLRKY